jgi:2-C-methyl-D-erythritol 4-phosphate cytidylyltransferase
VTAQHHVRGDVAVLVPAAGLGLRLGAGIPKALRLLAGRSLLSYALQRVVAGPSVGCVVVAAPPGEPEGLGPLPAPVTVVPGGATRQASVAAALAAVPDGFDIILIHDAARALAPTSLIEAVAAAVRAGHDAVIPVLPVVDTVKEVAASGRVVGTVDRSVLRVVQTPQGFRRTVLAAAHAAATDEHTDDAGMVEKLGVPVHTVPGAETAFKITRPVDLLLAEALLSAGTLAS